MIPCKGRALGKPLLRTAPSYIEQDVLAYRAALPMIWLPSSPSPPLLKIPLLFAAMKITALGMAPPTPLPTIDEKKGYGNGKDPMTPLLMQRNGIFKLRRVSLHALSHKASTYSDTQGIMWANAICESTVILARQFPSSLSDTALALLVRRATNCADRIRITPLWLSGCILMVCGGYIRLACYRTLGRLFTWELSLKKGHKLITHGPYSIVRHPSYVGSAMTGVGIVLCNFAQGSWFTECVGWDSIVVDVLAAIWAAYNLAIPTLLMARVNIEDEVLKKEFGEQWEAYAKTTPYRLIPYLY
jgi:protein-S-isoprenylcysteine O-methyltransferase Ste14